MHTPKIVRNVSVQRAQRKLIEISGFEVGMAVISILFSPSFTRQYGDDGYWMAHTKIRNEMMLNERARRVNDRNICA